MNESLFSCSANLGLNMALVWTHSEWREKDKRDIKSDSEQKQRVREGEVARRGVMHVCTVHLERCKGFYAIHNLSTPLLSPNRNDRKV